MQDERLVFAVISCSKD